MKLIIIRHGETDYNKKKLIMGHLDIPLNETGITQAKRLAKRLKNEKIDYIYSSDLARAKETAELINEYHNKKIFFKKSLRERYLGKFSGKNVELLRKSLKNIRDKELRGTLPGNLENLSSLRKRATSFLSGVYKTKKGKTILISTHGGLKKSFLMYLNSVPLEKFDTYTRFDNTSLSIIEFNLSKNHKIILENCTKHLK